MGSGRNGRPRWRAHTRLGGARRGLRGACQAAQVADDRRRRVRHHRHRGGRGHHRRLRQQRRRLRVEQTGERAPRHRRHPRREQGRGPLLRGDHAAAPAGPEGLHLQRQEGQGTADLGGPLPRQDVHLGRERLQEGRDRQHREVRLGHPARARRDPHQERLHPPDPRQLRQERRRHHDRRRRLRHHGPGREGQGPGQEGPGHRLARQGCAQLLPDGRLPRHVQRLRPLRVLHHHRLHQRQGRHHGRPHGLRSGRHHGPLRLPAHPRARRGPGVGRGGRPE
ncbi:hypothetical protein SALBM135S_09257 [Streptomyces alboniger]